MCFTVTVTRKIIQLYIVRITRDNDFLIKLIFRTKLITKYTQRTLESLIFFFKNVFYTLGLGELLHNLPLQF